MPRFAVILPAAGQSSRFRDKAKKIFANLDGRAVWLRTAEQFVTRDDVAQTVVVIAPEAQELLRRCVGAQLAFMEIQLAEGGKHRFDSVANAPAKLKDEVEFVAMHDGARPCVSREMIDTIFAVGARTGAAMLAIPVTDTLKRGEGD